MLNLKQLALVIGDKTKVKILKLLSEKSLTLTQVFTALPEIKYRESAHKALQKLVQTGLVKRRFSQKKRAYFYSIDFKKIELDAKLKVKQKN